MKTTNCPNCGEPARLDDANPYRPFCSRRCKLVDLGDWFEESNNIPGPEASGQPWQDDNSHQTRH